MSLTFWRAAEVSSHRLFTVSMRTQLVIHHDAHLRLRRADASLRLDRRKQRREDLDGDTMSVRAVGSATGLALERGSSGIGRVFGPFIYSRASICGAPKSHIRTDHLIIGKEGREVILQATAQRKHAQLRLLTGRLQSVRSTAVAGEFAFAARRVKKIEKVAKCL